MTGEFEYEGIFLGHFTSDAYQDRLIYKVPSCIIFVVFVLSMSLIVSNLLVSYESNVAVTLNGFDDQERNLTIVKTAFQETSCVQ